MLIEHQISILEGSRNAKDWNKTAENQLAITGINYIIKYIKIEL